MNRRGPIGAVAARHPRWSGLLLAALLLVAYVGVVRPVRVWVAQAVAAPALKAISAPRAQGFERRPTPGQPALVFERSGGDGEAAGYLVPVGGLFLLPALLLVALFPARPYAGYLLLYHLALGVLGFGLFALGLSGSPAALSAYAFTREYLAEAVGLAVPAVLLVADRAGAPVAGEAPASAPRRAKGEGSASGLDPATLRGYGVTLRK